jgi:TatD DNase family protein
MPLVDSHCHLQDAKFDADREEVLARALETLDWLVVIGDDVPTSERALALLRPRIYASVGTHPYYAGAVDDRSIERLREMARVPGVVAIGEIGLDYYKHNQTPRDVQRRGFVAQLELAAELSMPVVIHNRDADADLTAILNEHAAQIPGGVLHCFAGGTDLIGHAHQWGFYISFAGNVTYPKAQALRDSAKLVRDDRLLIETDAPYLAPQAVRGRRCEPQFVMHTAECLAQVRGVSLDALSGHTAANAARLFRIAPRL